MTLRDQGHRCRPRSQAGVQEVQTVPGPPHHHRRALRWAVWLLIMGSGLVPQASATGEAPCARSAPFPARVSLAPPGMEAVCQRERPAGEYAAIVQWLPPAATSRVQVVVRGEGTERLNIWCDSVMVVSPGCRVVEANIPYSVRRTGPIEGEAQRIDFSAAEPFRLSFRVGSAPLAHACVDPEACAGLHVEHGTVFLVFARVTA